MIGRIRVLDPASASGMITAENGAAVSFDLSAVLAYDATCLAVNQTVTFDLDSINVHKAINVCIQVAHRSHPAGEKRVPVPSLRYVGFAQNGDVRSFRFERHAAGEETRLCTVDADLVLFRRHHIVIQEGPQLCFRLLSAEMEGSSLPATVRSITEEFILQYAAGKAAQGPKSGRKSTAAAFSAHPA